MDIQYLIRENKPKLAYVLSPATAEGKAYPLVMFMGGYRSDMSGTKATYLEQQCRARGQAFLRFDYSGHGQSEGAFEDGAIGAWLEDALAVLDHAAAGKSPVIVGSSMGGWIGLLAAQARAGAVQGFIGIAAAPDFTEGIYAALTDEQRKKLKTDGRIEEENDYSDQPYVFTQEFFDEARRHLVLNKSRRLDFPVRLIQGMKDTDVPWETAVKIQKTFEGGDLDIVFIEEGDHRLSRPEDLALIDREVKSISGYL